MSSLFEDLKAHLAAQNKLLGKFEALTIFMNYIVEAIENSTETINQAGDKISITRFEERHDVYAELIAFLDEKKTEFMKESELLILIPPEKKE